MTAETRDSNRAAFPELAAIMDQFRQHFTQAKLIHGEEGGRVIGKCPPEWYDTPNQAMGAA